jgi:membrane protein YqaA with SNARE-associated domain
MRGSGVMLTPLCIAAVVLGMSFATAFVPLGPPEAYILAYVSTGHSVPFWAFVMALAAASGQMVGKLAVFQLAGRSARGSSRLMARLHAERLMSRVTDHTQRYPRHLAALVATSALVGLPPLAVVAPLAGAAAMRGRQFFTYGFAGRLARFSLLALVPLVMHY